MKNYWDNLVGFFSPATQLKNEALRQIIREKRSAYNTGDDSASLTGTWDKPETPNSGIRSDRKVVTDRVRQLVRKMPWLEGAIESSEAYKVGEGFTHKPCVRKDDGSLDQDVNKKIKDAFLNWCETAEINGQDNFFDIQQLICRQMIECGEAISIYRYNSKDGFKLQLIEPDCLRTVSPAEDIDQGIRFDPITNKPLEYHFTGIDSTPLISSKNYACKADVVSHLFFKSRPWQRRGISPLAQTIVLAADLGEYLSNEIAAQQMASRYLAFVTDPNADSIGFEEKAHKVLYNLTIEYMQPGKQVQIAPGGNRPTLGVETFQDIFLRILSVKLKTPYHVISAKYNNMNYNTLREVRNNTIHLLKKDWSYMSRHFLQKTYEKWLDFEVISGRLNLKGYWDNGGKRHYSRAYWMPPGIESVDILRDIKGVILGGQNGIYDPQDWIMSNGEDPEETVSGIQEFNKLLKDRGLNPITLAQDESNDSLENDTGDGGISETD